MSSTVVRLFQPPAESIAFLRHTPAQAEECGDTLSLQCTWQASQDEQHLLRNIIELFDLNPTVETDLGAAPRQEERQRGARSFKRKATAVLTSSAVEIEEAAGGKVHPLLALAVVVQGDLLRLRQQTRAQ